ncbi:MAG: anion transporter, partial [Wenzhouxiangella sp.]|nr:anion transporter [Wenzhouxiangella sp.]
MSPRLTLPQLALGLGPGLAGALLGVLLGLDVLGWAASVTAAVTLWCAIWWLTEPVPIPVTSLLPMALFPLLGVITPTQVAQSY